MTQPNLKIADDGGKKPRKRNVLFDAVCDCLFEGKATKGNSGLIAKYAQELLELGATPEELRRRIANYKAMWPTYPCTPHAVIMKHWPRLAKAPSDEGKPLGAIAAPPGKYERK